MLFLVRLFPEITIKSHPVRKRLTRFLTENLRVLTRRIHSGAKVKQDWDKLEVRIPSEDEKLYQEVADLLGRTAGIANYSAVRAFAFSSLQDIAETTFESWHEVLEGKTFCVRVRRIGQHDFTSTDVERYVGGELNQRCSTGGVKLKNPDITINLEIKNDTAYLVEQRYEGLGGFPVGSQGSVLSLVSGGFDSTIASYMMIRRGLRTHFCFFNLGGRDHELAVKEVAFYLWNRFGSSHRVRFITVPFEGVVAEILEKIDPSNMGVVLKRMMLRAAERVAAHGGVQALVTGEAISQVSSQTLPNLTAIDQVTNMLVLRPLITMDKPEIIQLARKIGTEELCGSIPEYCGVISVRPSAKVNPARVEEQEAGFDFDLLDQAVNQASVQVIDEVMADVESRQTVEVCDVPAEGATIIDIRHPNERDMKPLQIEHSVLCIPFYSLGSEYPKLDQRGAYLLYCDKGVMSRLHAAHLMDGGYNNIGVYRPARAPETND